MAEKKEILKIGGMSCEMCVKTVAKALKSLEGVSNVHMILKSDEAEVTFDDEKVGRNDFKKAVEEAGYELL
ncbi:MAG: heavy-metal-associated domain-containing protein [Bacillota bacterium]